MTIREISLSQQGRLRLFGADSDRNSDTVNVNSNLTIDEAIDLYFGSGNLTKKFFQALLLNNLEDPTVNKLYGKVFHDSGSDNAIALTIKYYANASVNATSTVGTGSTSGDPVHSWTMNESSDGTSSVTRINPNNFSFIIWVTLNSDSSYQALIAQFTGSSQESFVVFFDPTGTNKFYIVTSSNGSSSGRQTVNGISCKNNNFGCFSKF